MTGSVGVELRDGVDHLGDLVLVEEEPHALGKGQRGVDRDHGVPLPFEVLEEMLYAGVSRHHPSSCAAGA